MDVDSINYLVLECDALLSPLSRLAYESDVEEDRCIRICNFGNFANELVQLENRRGCCPLVEAAVKNQMHSLSEMFDQV